MTEEEYLQVKNFCYLAEAYEALCNTLPGPGVDREKLSNARTVLYRLRQEAVGAIKLEEETE